MVGRVWWKLQCCSLKWILLTSPLLLLSLTIFLMAVTLPQPLPPSSVDHRPSRALSSAEDFVRPGPGVAEPAFANPPPLHIHSRAWRSSEGGEEPTSPPQPRPSGGNDSGDKKSFPGRSGFNRHKGKSKGIASKRNLPFQSRRRHQQRLLEFTVNSTQPQRRMRSRTKSERGAADRQAAEPADRRAHAHTQKHEPRRGASRPAVRFGEAAEAQLFSVHLKKHLDQNPSPVEKKPWSAGGPKPSSAQKDDGGLCGSFREQDFPDSDRRRIRMNRDRLPWFSSEDVQKLELLAGGEVVSKASVPAHGQVLQVGLHPAAEPQTPSAAGAADRPSSGHGERCRAGLCCLVKRTSDWPEVLAFHLDRVLGLNRSLPAVLRAFHSHILPYRYTGGAPRPAVWWDPGIRHLADSNNDQNSVALGWVRYQQLLQAHCGTKTDLNSTPCVGVQHAEWGRLALFDFLLQVNDRLDRYCCGFTPDPSELCVENLLHAKCGHAKDLLLVHILVRQADPSRLVFIDNAGRPQLLTNNLNFRLIEGIDQFPEEAVSILGSGCLETLLLRSLYVDREFWESRGGSSGLRPLVHMVQQRGLVLLQHIQDRKLQLRRDL